MSKKSTTEHQPQAVSVVLPGKPFLQQCADDPMLAVIAASLVTMSTLGFVLLGAWSINSIL